MITLKESLKELALTTAALLLAVALLTATLPPTVMPASPSRSAPYPTVVLDAGHGGMDGGAVGVAGTVERELNLAVAHRTELLLVLFGLPVAMTRNTDADVAPPGQYRTIAARKTADMHARVHYINSFPDALLLSIHMNTFTRSKFSGAQVFYAEREGSPELAEILQANLIGFADPDNRRVVMPAAKRLYLLKTVECPAVLIECGFLSNRAEEARLNTPSYQTTLAVAIAVSAAMYVTLEH